MRSARKTKSGASAATLCDMQPGESLRVGSVLQNVDPSVRRRLESLGFREGEEVTCLRRAPMGCPILFRVCGADICLRKEQARSVLVGDSAADRPQPHLVQLES